MNDKDNNIEEIIKKNSPAIFKYCLLRMNNNLHQADEIVSDVMCTLFEKWNKLEKDNITAWLYRVADNHIKNFFKRQKKELEKRLCYDDDELFQKLHFYDNYNDISDIELQKYIDEIYEKLSDDEKILYDLRNRQKLTLNEVVEKLSIPYSTLRYREMKLSIKLKELIKEISDKIEV